MRLSATLILGFVALVGAAPLGPKPCGTKTTTAIAKPQPMPDPSVFLALHNDFDSASASRARMRKYRKKMKIKEWRRMNCPKKIHVGTQGEEKILSLPKGCRRKTKSAADAEESEEPDDDDSGEDGFDI
ncbi:hypothetical protein C8J56DRAFT_382132 [Mycena floridula]|nr:hypothetical protein C8J56DRAFT_382132 [Mycena floridula]